MKKPLRAARLALRAARWYVFFWRKRPLPLACGCYITTRCNLFCNFCGLRRFPGTPSLPREEALRLARTLGEMKCVYFSISGGEPLLVEYTDEVLAAAKHAGVLYTHLVTNGLLLDEARARSLRDARLDEVSISIDGPAAFHDRLRGKEGSYAAAIAAIEVICRIARKTTVVVNSIVIPDQPGQILRILKVVEKFGIFMKIQPLNFHPMFVHNFYQDETSPPDEAGIKAVMRELARSSRVINSRAFLNSATDFLISGRSHLWDRKPCIFGYHHLEIWPDSTVYPCLEGMGWQSNFKLEDWPEVMYRSDYLRKLKSLKTCTRCRTTCYVCYYETRLSFPLGNYCRYR